MQNADDVFEPPATGYRGYVPGKTSPVPAKDEQCDLKWDGSVDGEEDEDEF